MTDNTAKKKNRYKYKGEAGYIRFKKSFELAMALGLLLIAAAVFTVGLALNEWNKGNIFTIIACLFVIPMARFATSFVLMFPFKSVSAEKAEEVASHARKGSIIYADVILTSDSKAMGLDFMVVTGDKILGVVSRAKDNNLEIRNYLQDVVKRRGFDYKVTIAEDYTRFYTLLNNSDSVDAADFDSEEERECFDNERAQLCSTLESLMP